MNLFQRIGRALRSAPDVSDAEFQDCGKRAMAKLRETAPSPMPLVRHPSPRKWEPINTQRILKAISVCALLAKSPEKPHLMRTWDKAPGGIVWGWVCASEGGRYGIADTPQGAMAIWASSYAPCNSASTREINAAQWAIVNRSRLARGEWDGVL